MGKISFLFSGQGDQFPGMGKDLYMREAAARRIFDLSESLRPGTLDQCFHGSEEALKETGNTQPCLYSMELAAAEVLKEMEIVPDFLAGFSLGEVTAATVSGLFDTETGFRLICERGRLMQQAAESCDTMMAAVLKLTPDCVRELCEKRHGIYPVNFNCPGQITVSGLTEEMAHFLLDVKQAGGRGIPLNVRGAFHSPFMAEAAAQFKDVLEREKEHMHALKHTLYSNLTAKPYGTDAVTLLSEQIKSPVRWQEIIEDMIASGTDTFIEIGPGRTLTNMMKKIDPTVKAMTVTEVLEARSVSCK